MRNYKKQMPVPTELDPTQDPWRQSKSRSVVLCPDGSVDPGL